MSHRRLRNGCGQAVWLALAGLLAGCGAPEPVPRVEYSGCAAVDEPDPVCILYPGRRFPSGQPEIRLWVEAPPGTKVELFADETPLPDPGEPAPGGQRYKLRIPPGTSSLSVQHVRADGKRSPLWTLRLSAPEEPRWLAEVEDLIARDARDNTNLAERRLTQLRDEVPPAEKGLVLRVLARMPQRAGEQEARDLTEGIAADRSIRRVSGVVEKSTLLARHYANEGRFADARRLLSALHLPAGAPADAKYFALFYQAYLANRIGDYRTALEQAQKAAELAEKVGMNRYRQEAERLLADVHQQLGRSEEASRRLDELLAESQKDDACKRAGLLTDWAWSQLAARETGQDAADPTARLEEARDLYDDNCARLDQRLNARLNLAFAHLQRNRWRAAEEALRQARDLQAKPTVRQRLWWDDLTARLEIAAGRAEAALVLYTALDEQAARALSAESRIRASLGRAHALLALDRREEALAALETVDRLVDGQLPQIPMQKGRDTFLADQQAATRLHLEILLDEGRRHDAFELVRRVRSRLLRQLTVADRLAQLGPAEQRQWDQGQSRYLAARDAIDQQAAGEWKLAGDEVERQRDLRQAELASALDALDGVIARLGTPQADDFPPLQPGEVVLAYHPLPSGWVGFAAHGREVEEARFELPSALDDRVALAHDLLVPFRAMIDRAERVRILPYGPLRKVDFHVLPFAGKPLLAGRPVVYGLDVKARSAAGKGPARRLALLVADPAGDLPAARAEADTVDAAIQAWGDGWTLERLDVTQARAEAVRQALPDAALFHYAGHGTFAGFGAWDSGLELADGSRLTPGDLLPLRVPAWIVLSSCDAARSSAEAPGEGLGLANAFLLAGARGVIAAIRPVPDRTGRDLMRELYRDWRPGSDLAVALQRAQLPCLQRDPQCASFRLIEP